MLLPHPSEACPWLQDFENGLFEFPETPYSDQVDAFGQLIDWLEHVLAEGWHARGCQQVTA